MVELNYDDVIQQYNNCIVLKGNEPVMLKVVDQEREGTMVRVTNLRTGKSDTEIFKQANFRSPAVRLGFMNVKKTCIHVSRLPVRKMQVGINLQNVRFTTLPREEDYQALKIAQGFGAAFRNTIVADYPTFSKAMKMVSEDHTAVAFDRQFAVTKDFKIFYKAQEVGTVGKNIRNTDHIVFKDGYEHLSILIGDKYEQSLQRTRAA